MWVFEFKQSRIRLKMVKKVIREKKNGGSNSSTSTNNLSKPKIGRMAWINYFASECKKKDANGNSKSRIEIGKTWNLLPIEEKAKFRQLDVDEVAARNLTAVQPNLRDNDFPNNSDLPPTDEEIPGTPNHPGHEDQTINTRCTPSRWCRIVKKLSEEHKEVVHALGFGNLLALDCGSLWLKICRWLVDNFDTKACALDIHGRRFFINSSVFGRVLGISDQGDKISIYGDVPNFEYWKSKFAITSRGIFLKDIEHSLEEMTTADYEFKVIFCLFLLGTILCPSAIDYVQTGYLIPLGDVGSIGTKNWSSWCLSTLCEGIDKYVKNRQRLKTSSISGCVLFLENPPMVDKALTPVVCWTNVKIKKCVTRLQTEGGVGSNKISIEDSFKQPSPSEGQYDAAAHGETSHGNQEPGTGNNAHMKGVHDVLQVVKEIQDTLKSELHDIRTKVNFLYAKFSSTEEKNFDEDLHNTTSHQKSKDDRPQNLTPNSPPLPSSRYVSIPTIQHPVVEVSSNKTQTSPQHEKNISKSTPSWMKSPTEATLEYGNTRDLPMHDQGIDDMYHVPAVLTVPSLVDEDTLKDDILEHESQSSNKRRVIQTRSTSKRKPSRYQISPYIAVPVNASTKYRYGPFQIGIQLNKYDEHLITYIFDKNLPSSEVIVDLGHLQVTRKSFRTLEPTKFVDSEIINLIPEYKTMVFKSKRSQLSWFLPTNYAYSVFTCVDGEQYSLKKSLSKLRESYMSDLRRCQQMESLDIVLADDIAVAFPKTFSFTSFSISYQKAPHQPNGYDCGLLLCMFMDDNCPTTLQMKSFQSECQRLFWARFLALFPGNTNLLSLKKKAKDHYNKLLSTGEVVPNVKMRPAPMKKLRGKAAALLE
ncbi:hypothetical protein EZV62_022536 [Acer yangbiense]|uniref:Ubiquitin-like protease family profile domain-containing protein n=1 Tax=Acer yangbiense TaxID=1000413 RepID=A0A5C7H8S1_9ROSI|nr:hypothetical protein EZV62_022536 [Acer yangbiense]